MKKLTMIPLFLGGMLFSQQKQDSIEFRKIAFEVLNHSTAYDNLRSLTKDVGHRLSGSDAYEKAVDWSVAKLKEAGADKVWKQEVMIPVWKRGAESLQIRTKGQKWKSVNMLSLGNSEGTKGKDLVGEMIVVNSYAEFDKLPESAVKGKIVLFNYPFKQELISMSDAYGDASSYRSRSASIVAKKGGKAVVVRSLSSTYDEHPHTGSMRYEADTEKIPAVAVGTKTADEMQKQIRNGGLEVKLNSNCGMQADKKSYNVIAEITGKVNPQNIIIAAGHLDSWDVGEGAHDDGTGIVQSIEVLRAFKKLGIPNKNTIRVICYANEENGVRGGNSYLDYAKTTNENHLFAIESDAGGFTPRGFSLDMPESDRQKIQAWRELFKPYQLHDFENVWGGVDIAPLKALKVPLAGLVPDSQRYFDLHHSALDTFEQVNKRELLLGAMAMTQLIYMIDQNWK